MQDSVKNTIFKIGISRRPDEAEHGEGEKNGAPHELPTPALECILLEDMARVFSFQASPLAASASVPNTAKTNGFRSRLNTSTSRAERLICSQACAKGAMRSIVPVPLPSAEPSQALIVSMKAAKIAGSVPDKESPKACKAR